MCITSLSYLHQKSAIWALIFYVAHKISPKLEGAVPTSIFLIMMLNFTKQNTNLSQIETK